MAHFTQCVGREACTEDGEVCRGCRRTHQEIAATRALTTALSDFILEMDYDNAEEFLEHLTEKTLKKLKSKCRMG